MAAKKEAWAKTPGKTRNLTEQQVKQGQRAVGGGRTERLKKGEGAAAMAKVDIGQTKWTTAKERGGAGRGGLLTDASGKAVTGTVTLPSGKTASYVRGKRVTTMPSGGGGGTRGRGTGGGGGGGGVTTPRTPRPPANRGKMEQPGGSSGTAKYSPPARRVSPGARGEGTNPKGRGRTSARTFGGQMPGDWNFKEGQNLSMIDQFGRKRNYRMTKENTLFGNKGRSFWTEWA